jgi:photosystem II stability/assembly factor-like uncharacterized protein
LLACLLGLLVAGGPAAAGEPAPVAAREIRQNLFGTCFANAREGWMVGELGRVFHTRDGGATWERQDAGTRRPLLAIACVDPRTAWVAGKEGIVLGTTDGGVTWTPATTGSSRHLFTLAFPTASRGHGAGDFGTMVHTEDGGRTWTAGRVPEVRLPEEAVESGVEPGDVNLYALSYADADAAWLVGEFGTVLASGDGGLGWRQQRASVESTLFGVFFADRRRGWTVGADGVILHTEDGGETWVAQPGAPPERPLFDVAVRGDTGFIIGDAGTVLRSRDAGITWQVEPMPIQLAARWLRSVWLIDDAQGLAVGAEGLVLRLVGGRLERLAAAGDLR